MDDVVISLEDIFLDERSDKLGSLANVVESFLLFLLQVLLKRVKFTYILFSLLLHLHELLLLFLVNTWDINKKETLEPCSHLFFVAEGVKAHNEIEADIEVGSVIHDVFIHLDGLAEALLLNKSQTNILLNLKLHLLILLRCGVNCHVVILDGHIILLLLEVNIAHIDTESRGLGILLVLEDNSVTIDSLGVQSIGVVHVGQVVEDVEGKVNIDLIKTASLFTE